MGNDFFFLAITSTITMDATLSYQMGTRGFVLRGHVSMKPPSKAEA
jgi:hypothetical protein